MKKTKDGKVFASLTEVKNKTGDIFALADEFGEVILTSYNKPRYKIVKTDISSILSLTEEEPAKETRNKPAAVKQEEKKPEVKKVETKQENTPEKEEKSLVDSLIKINRWERDNKQEKTFVQNATRSLIS